MNDKEIILNKEFLKKCWQIDYIPLGVSCFLLFLNLLVGPNLASMISVGLSMLCIFTVLATMQLDKKYLIMLSQEREDTPDLILTRLGHFKRATLVGALIFYFIGWAL
jgi:hypothetical protein